MIPRARSTSAIPVLARTIATPGRTTRTSRSSSREYSSGRGPVSCSRTSSWVAMPASPPLSSTAITSWLLWVRITSITSGRGSDSGSIGQPRARSPARASSPRTSAPSTSSACTTPLGSSIDSRYTTSLRLPCVSIFSATSCSEELSSTATTSTRGTMALRSLSSPSVRAEMSQSSSLRGMALPLAAACSAHNTSVRLRGGKVVSSLYTSHRLRRSSMFNLRARSQL
nr:hypothetical protein [Thermobaculum terrenum]